MKNTFKIFLLAWSTLQASSLMAEALEGHWKFSCVPFDSFHEDITYKFDHDYVTQERQAFGDDYCRMPMVQVNWVWSAHYPGDGKIDLTLKAQFFRAMFPGVVQHLNQTRYCGFSDWVLNEPKNVTGLTCDSFTYPSAGTTYYQIFGVNDGKLFWGDVNGSQNGSSNELRPTSFNHDRPYVKIP